MYVLQNTGAQLDSPLLHHVTLIDTPGVLSGEKQRIGRTYSFTEVCHPSIDAHIERDQDR